MRAHLCLIALLLALLAVMPAFAQSSTATPGANFQWSQIAPGNDFLAQVLQGIFPLSSSAGGPSTGTGGTIIGTLLGYFTGFILAIMATYVVYTSIMHIHRGAETADLLTRSMTSMFIVRLVFATVMALPVAGAGFSVGQRFVNQIAMWSIGMARFEEQLAITGIGPDSMAIATPLVPGTKMIVVGLIEAEFCRDLINGSSNNPGMMPQPAQVTQQSVAAAAGQPAQEGFASWTYSFTPGNRYFTATCGSVKVGVPAAGAVSIAGVNVDTTAMQSATLQDVLTYDIRPQVQSVVDNLWQTRQSSALTPLMNILVNATNDYTSQLTNQASSLASQIRTAVIANNAASARTGAVGLLAGMQQMSNLGVSGLGAYFLTFTRLNGETLSLMENTPTVNPPNYLGIPASMMEDMRPLVAASQVYMQDLMTYAQTADATDTPVGHGDQFTGAGASADGSSVLETMTRALGISKPVLMHIITLMQPTGNVWQDPISSLVTLGHVLTMIALGALGLAGLLSSNVGTVATAVWAGVTGGVGGVAATVAGHLVVQFLATPIMIGCMALLMPGLTIAFILPMIPYTMWIAGIAGWLILVCEAMIMVPIWMLAHLTFEGEGLHGRAVEGWGLLFNVLFRLPVLVLGFFTSYWLYASMSWLIRSSFGAAAGFAFDNGFLVTNLLGVVVMCIVFVLMHVVIMLLAFRLPSTMAHHMVKLVGFSPANRVDAEDFANSVAYLGARGGLTTLQRGLTPGSLPPAGAGPRALPSYMNNRLLPGRADTTAAPGKPDPTLEASTKG